MYSLPALSYQWYNVASGLIAGAINQTYVIAQPGSYYCLVTDSIGCVAASNTVVITGQLSIIHYPLSIFPKPVTNELTITGTAINGVAVIYDVTGKEMLHIKTDAALTKINTSNLADGFYVLNYSFGNKTVNVKVMKY